MAHELIAIVGRGCVLPGALSPDEFWANIAAGTVSLSPVSRERFDQAFDPDGFAADPDEIMRLDRLYRWVLHAGRQALREANQELGQERHGGLVLGNLSYPSASLTGLAGQVWRDGQPAAGADPLNRFCSGLPAHFAARALGLAAGGFALDAACASSLYAVKLGCDRLADGTADLMLAGAVTAPDDLLIQAGFRALSALSRTGRSRPFHRAADGLVPGEGAVLVALMRLADVVRAGAPVLGVIQAIGLSNDGQAGGLLAPDAGGQVRAMRQAYDAAGIPPETVSLLECHATGTPVGDGVEARSAARVFAGSPDLPIGSVKSNVGHLLAAAGGAGLLKVLGAMRAGIRPATLSVDDPIPELDGGPLRLLAEPEDWPGRRRAAVSAFGFGGANAHLVVDAAEPAATAATSQHAGPARERIAITAIGAKVADGADAEDFRRTVLLGQPRDGRRDWIDVAVGGLRFPPVDLEATHAQHVLVLEAAREAVRGLRLPRERTMVVVGMGTDPEVARYAALRRASSEAMPLTAAGVLGTMPNLVANRINMQLDLTGPGYTVSAEETSGLVALELAARALRTGEADAALAGAVDLSCEQVHQAALRALGIERQSGDAAVVLVLKRLADARRDGDQVIAVLDDAGKRPDLVVGDDGLDPAGLFGVAHAAYGLVCAAVAAVAVRHRCPPGTMTARATARPLGGSRMSVTLCADGTAEPWIPGPAPALHVYSGPNRDAVLRALADGRESSAGPARLAIVADPDEPPSARADAVRRWLDSAGPRPGGVAYRDAPAGGEVAFVFTHGSAAYQGMGTELALAFPAAAGAFKARHGASTVLDKIWGAAWLSCLHAEISRTVLGIRPAAAIGYSSGESAALAALGAWTDADALYADLRASDLFTTGLTGEFRVARRAWQRLGLPGERWVSYLVSATADQVRAVIDGEPAVHLLAVNAPDACFIGGEATACEAAVRRLGADAVAIDFDIIAHAPELAEVRQEYRRLHLRPTSEVPGIRFYSGATAEHYATSGDRAADRAADAILAQALGTVDFVRVIERAWADGVRVFVEHGPGGQCTGWIRRILGEREHVAVALDAPGGRALRQICLAVAELAAAGVPVDAAAFFGHLRGAAADRTPAGQATIRLAAHPPELRISRARISQPMPRAPVLDAYPAAEADSAPQTPAVARLIAAQFRQATSLHKDFLERQAQAHAQYLNARQRSIAVFRRPSRPGPKFCRAELEHLAAGKISGLFGPRFAVLDGRMRQTRLPEPPLLLVDRVTGIDGAAASMDTGTIWTETDITADSWYLDGTGRIPAGMMVEAGQADLLLISWLGIDLYTPGDRVYRLLGCELTFHGSPAQAGDTLRYEIRIDRHAEQGGVRLFFFGYDCYVGTELRMTVRNGQAGFFTDEELHRTSGVRWSPDQEPPADVGEVIPPRLPPAGRRFGPDAVRAFAAGRPADCFGGEWRATRAHVRTPRIGDGRMLLLGEVTDIDPAGGPWGCGYLRAETTVRSDDWFFSGHFKNDPCMPGTLMFEGGLQAMAFYLAALGFTVDRDGWRFEPVPERQCLLRCRGQVSPASRRIVYEVLVSGLIADPYPTLRADVLGTVDGVKAFHAHQAGLRLVPDWPLGHHPGPPDERAAFAGGIRQDYPALLGYAQGRFGQAIGPAFAHFDDGRRAPRLPGPPYHFMTRVTAIDGPLGGMRPGSAATAEYDVPERAWYFEQSQADAMPVAVLMEVGLQPCGWLAMYIGSVLDSDTDLLFRNLDGTATFFSEVRPGAGSLRTRVELLDISRSDGMIIESFRVECSTASGLRVFEMETAFGFFPAEMLQRQVGLPVSAAERSGVEAASDVAIDLRGESPRPRLAGPMLLMLDRITGYWPEGGAAGLGRLRAEKDIDPDDWFFKAHFFTDPVQPGSLGVQAMYQLLQWYLGGTGAEVLTQPPVTWKYRGQVVPANERITIEMEITERGEDAHGAYAIATAWLWVDGLRIYQVRDLGMRTRSR